MTSADFSLAQQRVAARRRLRETEAQARLAQQQNSYASTTNDRLPFPLSRFGRAGLQGWNSIKGREGTRPAFRVGQVDAELLDEELLDLLKAQVGEALKYFGVRRKHFASRRAGETDDYLVASTRRMVFRDSPRSPRSALQAYDLGP